jgi:uncharacterized protein (TIGR00369 family)
MGDTEATLIPEGFERLPEGFGFADSLQPSYGKVDESEACFGLVVEQHHCNMMGICHGGVLMTLADMAGAAGINLARGELAGSPTINLNIDLISPARLGTWVQASIDQVSIKRRFGFCRGSISNESGVVAQFSGTFYFPGHDGMWKEGNRKESVLEKFQN